MVLNPYQNACDQSSVSVRNTPLARIRMIGYRSETWKEERKPGLHPLSLTHMPLCLLRRLEWLAIY